MGATIRLLPVCECGHIISDLELDQTESWCGNEYCVPFTPAVCPNCNQIIETMTIDTHFLIAFGFREG